jgi:hypothetical protein
MICDQRPEEIQEMKKPVIAVLTIALIAVIVFVIVSQGGAKALNVRDVGGDPSSFSGTITITGIMGGVSQQDPSIFGIMDIKELQCTTPNCNRQFIPVRYQGRLPAVGDEVKVTGSFINVSGGYLFAAQNVRVLRNHRIGG